MSARVRWALALAAALPAAAHGVSIVSDPTWYTPAPVSCAFWVNDESRESEPLTLPVALSETTQAPYCRLPLDGIAAGDHTLLASFVVPSGEVGPTSALFSWRRTVPVLIRRGGVLKRLRGNIRLDE